MRMLQEFVHMIQREPERTYRGSTEHPKKVILSKIEETKVIINDSMLEYTLPDEIQTDIAPPFETCWIQCPEGTSILVADDHGDRNVYGIWLHEHLPHVYLFGIVLDDPVEPHTSYRLQVGYMDLLDSKMRDNATWQVVSGFLQPFGKEYALGVEKSSARFRFKRDGKKHLHKIRKVVHVVPKTKSAMSKLGDKIDWSHKWRVRGHWRQLASNGIGKNRQGEYCIKGWTWVTDFVKGEGELIEKTRIIKGEK